MTEDLVPGDFIYLSTGTFDYWHIPGDIRIIHINQPVVVESYFLYKDCLNYLKEMTKEQTSEDPLKTNNLLFHGTTLFSGDCIGLVFHTGENMLLNNVPDDLLATPELPESEDEDKEDGGLLSSIAKGVAGMCQSKEEDDNSDPHVDFPYHADTIAHICEIFFHGC